MEEFFSNPFFIGLGVGLVLAILTWATGALQQRKLKKEIAELKRHLHLQMTITNKGNEELQREFESLKRQNENLRITVTTLQQKPGRAELRTLHMYDRAINLMRQRAPGFAPAWEEVFQEAEGEMRNAESGLGKLLKKVFRPSLITETTGSGKSESATDKEEEKGGGDGSVESGRAEGIAEVRLDFAEVPFMGAFGGEAGEVVEVEEIDRGSFVAGLRGPAG